MSRKSDSIVLTTAATAELLMLSPQRLDQLVAEGWFKRHAPGRFLLVDAVQGYIRSMREGRYAKSQADGRVRDLRSQEIQVRTFERLGRLVHIEEFDAMTDGIAGLFRSELAGQPSRVTRDLALRRVIEQDVHGIFQRVAGAAEQIAARLPETRPLGAAIGTAAAGPLGGGEPDVSANGADTGAA